MKREREHAEASRYLYDFGLCHFKRGWAQIDTSSDASYYGNWLHAEKRLHFSYVEGDCCLTTYDNDAEMVADIREMKEWHTKNGKFHGIDCYPLTNAQKQRIIDAGLAEFCGEGCLEMSTEEQVA